MPATIRFEEEAQSIDEIEEERNAFPHIYWGGEVFDIPEPEWILPGFIIERGITVVAADPQAGKSLVMMDWANTLSAPGDDWNWLGRPRAKRCRTLYIVAEGQGGVPYRLRAWMQHRKFDQTPHVGWVMEPVTIWHNPGEPGQLQQNLIDLCQEQAIDVLFIDTLAATFGGGNENSQQDMNQYMAVCKKITRQGTAVVIAHHRSRGGNLRGSTVLPGDADLIVSLEGQHDDDHVLEHITVALEKQKDGTGFRRFVLQPVEYVVGESRSGEPLTSVALERAEPGYEEQVLNRNAVKKSKGAPRDATADKVRIVQTLGRLGPVSKTELRKNVGGNAAATGQLIEQLVTSGDIIREGVVLRAAGVSAEEIAEL